MDSHPVVQAFQPCPALRSFVSSYTIIYLLCDGPFVRMQPAFAQEYLILYPLGPQEYSKDGNNYRRLPQELLIGPFTQPVYLLQSPLQIMVLVNLLPGTLHRLIHVPMHEILNLPFEAINGFGAEIKRLNERLVDPGTPEQMIHLIEAFLVKKLEKVKEPLPIDQVLRLLTASPHLYSIDQLANLACVSLRQFERQFLNRIGTTPTMFIRQARFGRAYHLKHIHPKLSWTSIAHECGYFDQMHFIRDFRLFAAATPTGFKSILPAPVMVPA